MNKTKVLVLLAKWNKLIDNGEHVSKSKIDKRKTGLMTRIKRTQGKPVIFDFETYENQLIIQTSLCKEMPQWSDLIRSEPEIMDGYNWTVGDFIELYFEHFKMVVEKLQRIINK